ncbi:pyruvate, water dikinase regulatory protein [Desulfolithobacter sp.]
MWRVKDVYYVSDSAAILTEELGRSLLCQFHEIGFNEEKIPFIRNVQDARKALDHIIEQSGGMLPLVFCTIMDDTVREVFHVPEVEFFDIYGKFLDKLERCLETKALREPGAYRQMDDQDMGRRVEAIHYTLAHDDGTRTREYNDADIILLGVSRSGKTPVSVYLATHMGLKVANFPLTEEHLSSYQLHEDVVRNREKVVGLSTSPQLLHRVREKRYSGSRYASISTCSRELQQAEQMYQRYGIPVVHTDGKSIEEISVQVTQLVGISRKKWRRA